mmetsp:Transcript_53285/g.79594  ORF Transcript_53285/g.79594 Transcript_53285/m.79594 type:complete len:88 (+) Transcript_53285:152-415(+)
MQKTGIDKKQLKNWFTNAGRRILKPMLKKQLDQGKLAATPRGGGVAVPGVVQSITSMFHLLPFMSLLGKVCPPGAETATFAFVSVMG